MSQIRECSRKPRPVDEEGGRYISFSPPVEPASASKHKKSQKKKREKNSWKNGGFGAVNPKCQGRFLKVTQLSGRLGRGRKIEEIPSFREVSSRNPARGDIRGFKLFPAAATATKIVSSSLIPPSPSKIIKASERACSVLEEVKKNSPLALAPLSSIQYSIPRQDSADCLAPQQRPRTVISADEPLFTPVVVSLPVRSIPETPLLIKAVIHRDYQLLEQLLCDLPVDVVNAQDTDGRTALHHAVLHRDLRAVTKLIECGKVDCNACDSKGNTALIIAFGNTGFSEITRCLLACPGNDGHQKNKLDHSAMSTDQQCNDEPMVALLIKRSIIKFSEEIPTQDGVRSQEIYSQLTVLKQAMGGYNTENSASRFRKPSGHEIGLTLPCNYNHRH